MPKHQLQWGSGSHEVIKNPGVLRLNDGKLVERLVQLFARMPSANMATYAPDSRDIDSGRDLKYYLGDLGQSLTDGALSRAIATVGSNPSADWLGMKGLYAASSFDAATAQSAHDQAREHGRQVYSRAHPIGLFQKFEDRVFGMGVTTLGQSACMSVLVS